MNFVYKKQDEKDERACSLYLTEKVKILIPKICEYIQAAGKIVT
ncbi:TPA: hypothetical protein ACX96Z_000103 [Clostridium sporogenes]